MVGKIFLWGVRFDIVQNGNMKNVEKNINLFETEMHETALCSHTHIYISITQDPSKLDYQLEHSTIDHLHLLGYNTSITNQEVLVLSPTQQICNGQVCSVLTNNLNVKGPI